MRFSVLVLLTVFCFGRTSAQEIEQSRHYLGLHYGIQITRLQEKNNLRFYNSMPYAEREGGVQYRYILHQQNKTNLTLHTEFLGSMKGGYYELQNYGTILFEQRFTQFNLGLMATFTGEGKGIHLGIGAGLRKNTLFFSSTQHTAVPDFNFKMKYPGAGYISLSNYYGMEAYYDIISTPLCTYRGFVFFNFEQDLYTDTFIFRSYYAGIGLGYVFNKRKTLKKM